MTSFCTINLMLQSTVCQSRMETETPINNEGKRINCAGHHLGNHKLSEEIYQGFRLWMVLQMWKSRGLLGPAQKV